MDTKAIAILCTAPDMEVAARLSRGLVDARLAACVNAIPGVRSFYRWQGEVKEDPEVQLIIKTRANRYPDVERWILEHHPYEVPELLAFSIEAGSPSYLKWLEQETM